MAIKKVTRTTKETGSSVASSSDIEHRRKEFQEVASGKKKIAPSNPKPAAPKTPTQSIGRRTVAGVIIVLFLILAPLVAFAAYYSVSRSPERIVSEALFNTLAADTLSYSAKVSSPTRQIASINGQSGDGKSKIDASFRTTYPGELSTATVSLVASDQDMYFNIPNASKLVAESMPPSQQELFGSLQPILERSIDGKWVNVQPKDNGYLQSLTRVSSCVINSLRAVATDKDARTRFADVYAKQPFFDVERVKTAPEEGVYQLTIDQARFNTFIDKVTQSSDTVPFGKCNSEINAVKQSQFHEAVIEVTVNEPNRIVTKLAISQPGATQTTTTIIPETNKEVSINVPQDAVRFDEVKTEIIATALKAQLMQ